MQQLIYRIINPVVHGMIKVGITPNIITTTGLVLNIAAAVVFVYAAVTDWNTALTYAGWAGGLVLLLVLLRPVTGLLSQLPRLDLPDWRAETAQREAELRQDQETALEGFIEGELQSYIWDKEQSLGLAYPVSVSTRPGAGGGSVPDRVSIDGPFHQELSDWLTTELGLGPESQIWREE